MSDWPHSIPFDPANPSEALAALPSTPAVFALLPHAAHAEPYLGRTPDLRGRLRRLLTPSAAHPRRLQLASLVARIAWAPFASTLGGELLFYQATQQAFGPRAASRLHLRAPGYLRLSLSNRFPRLYSTATITHPRAPELFGPFPSRLAADRFGESTLDLFLLRRCWQELTPDPAFPGCIYSEMKRCLAPCYGGCSDERYASESAEVHAFLLTRGQSLLRRIAAERDQASEALDFEAAAQAHARYARAEAVASQASEAFSALEKQEIVIVQPALPPGADEPDGAAVSLFLLRAGTFAGPVPFSTLGMRHPNEHSGSSSLFAHPVAMQPTPLGGGAGAEPAAAADLLEARLDSALQALHASVRPGTREQLCDHLALFARWYFRPQAKRQGEAVFFHGAAEQSTPPGKLLLRAISRVWRAAQPAPPPLSAP